MPFHVACPCGQEVVVSEDSAGAEVQCACGGIVSVPPLETLVETERKRSVFHRISWVLCTFGLAGALAAWIGVAGEKERPYTVAEHVVGIVLTVAFGGLYLCLPYWIYDRHLNRDRKVGLGLFLVFFLFTGLCGGIFLMVVWDLIRLVQYLIMRPPVPIRYSVNTRL